MEQGGEVAAVRWLQVLGAAVAQAEDNRKWVAGCVSRVLEVFGCKHARKPRVAGDGRQVGELAHGWAGRCRTQCGSGGEYGRFFVG
jgi:hypothetical protein